MVQQSYILSTDVSFHPHSSKFFLPYLVPLLTILTQYLCNPFYALIPAIFVWIIIPLLDICIKPKLNQSHSLTSSQRALLEKRLSFKLAVWLWCPTHLFILVWGAYTFTFSLHPARLIGLLTSIGLIAAEAINAAHELLHRRSIIERTMANLMLVSVCYGHFAIEHARGHHFHVATPTDPATMRFNESFYSFLPRTLVGSYKSAWRYEATRMKHITSTIWSIQNHMIRYAGIQLVFIMSFWLFGGFSAVFVFLVQSAFAIVLLEQVNAIEHYGLVRKKLLSGNYEKISQRHSWDAPHRISSYFMFKLQLHAHHHLHASHRYQTLQPKEGSPQLPYGYLTLAPMLLIPPLWRRVMHPVLFGYWQKWADQDGTSKDAISYIKQVRSTVS